LVLFKIKEVGGYTDVGQLFFVVIIVGIGHHIAVTLQNVVGLVTVYVGLW
jgi:hypothetical protein